jgi:flagellar basal body P-ring formation protein FlgA
MNQTFIRPALPIVLLLACGLANPADAAEVKLRERVTPMAAVVRLGDVAEVTAADRQQARQLAAVPLMPAPAPDTERFLRKREIADMLAANGVELGSIHFSGAEQVAVAALSSVRQVAFQETSHGNVGAPANRHAAILAGSKAAPAAPQLNEAQVDELKVQLGRIAGDYLKTKSGKVDPARVNVAMSDWQLAQVAGATSLPVCGGGSEPWTGRQKLTLSFATAAGKVQLPLYVDVAEAAAPLVVLTRPVARGNIITGADVVVRMVEPTARTTGQRATFDAVEKIIGMEAKASLQADEVVFADQVQSPVLVKRGDVITVGSQSGGIRVRTTARATQDGAKGDLIQVESLETKQKFDVRVVGLREAAVFTAARVATREPRQRADAARR